MVAASVLTHTCPDMLNGDSSSNSDKFGKRRSFQERATIPAVSRSGENFAHQEVLGTHISVCVSIYMEIVYVLYVVLGCFR